MIELRISGENAQEFFNQISVLNAVLARAIVPAAPSVGSVETETSTETTEAPAETIKRGRKKKEDPAPEAVEAKQVADETTAAPVAEEIDVPKDLEGMRALLGSLIPRFGVEAVNAIVHPIAPVLSKVPLEEYPKIARLAHKKLAEPAA